MAFPDYLLVKSGDEANQKPYIPVVLDDSKLELSKPAQ